MAKPYFTGNYGSALARVDTRPIIEAGRATGQMYAQMGKDIGGVIKEYGLNKVKRAKLTGEIEAHYEDNPEALSQIGMSGDEAQDKKDYTERERFIKGDMNMAQLEGLAGKLARGGVLQAKRSQIEAQDANTRNLRLEGDLSAATQTNKIAMSALTKEATELQNQKFKIHNAILTTQSADEKNRLEQQERLIDARIDNLKETTRGLGGANDIFDLTKDARIAQIDLETSRLATSLILGATQIEKLQREIDLLGINDTQERRKLEEQIKALQASTGKDLEEAQLFKAQAAQIKNLTGGELISAKPFELEEGIEEGAQGDLPGIAKNAANALFDFMTLGTPFPKSRDAKAKVEVLRSQLMPAFLGSISDKGALWAKDEVLRFMPAAGDSDGVFRAKMGQLPNILRAQLDQDRALLRLSGVGTESQRGQAARNIHKFPLLIESLEGILTQDTDEGEAKTEEDLLQRYTR